MDAIEQHLQVRHVVAQFKQFINKSIESFSVAGTNAQARQFRKAMDFNGNRVAAAVVLSQQEQAVCTVGCCEVRDSFVHFPSP